MSRAAGPQAPGGAKPSTAAALRPISVRAAVQVAAAHLDRRPLLVVTDFDGTLSKIVNDPWGAAILPLGRSALRSLAGLDGVHVVVLSGRSSRDVAARVRVGGVSYVGNHGMERAYLPRGGRPESMTADVDEASHEAIHAAERVGEEMPRLINEPWLVVEPKPPSVAFHWRQAPDIDAAAAKVMAAIEELDPDHVLEQFPGRRVLELRPPGAVAKGEAFERMVEEWNPRSVFLLGDDVSDAMAFRSLRQLRAAGVTDGVAVAVQARAEVPPAVLEAADIVLASPVEATRFLSALARRLRR